MDEDCEMGVREVVTIGDVCWRLQGGQDRGFYVGLCMALYCCLVHSTLYFVLSDPLNNT